MIKRECFTESHIRKLQEKSHKDPVLLERAVYAFGLLEAITEVGMPFIFKGGTCLMLLFEHLRRLSTDIDIVVEPGVDVDDFIQKASVIFPFVNCEEQKRLGKNKVDKRHFKFTYDSPINGHAFHILLDVVFEENYYVTIENRRISNELLETEGEEYIVKVPSLDCILGDKLTAFAPHTTGIPINEKKDMEVMKQLYDICSLLDEFSDFEKVRITYEKVARAEILYRGDSITPADALMDTFKTAACLASRGKINGNEYLLYVKAIRDLRNHIFIENYSPEIAATRAPKVMYLAVCLITGTPYVKVDDYKEFVDQKVIQDYLLPLQSLKKANPEAYAYVVKADRLMEKATQYY